MDIQVFSDDDLVLSTPRTTPSKDFTDDVLGPGPPYNNDAAKQAANGLFTSFQKLKGEQGFFSFDESPLLNRPKPKADKAQNGRTAAGDPEGEFGFPSMMDSSPDIWSLFNGEWGNKIEGERRR